MTHDRPITHDKPLPGGRAAGLALLEGIDPAKYGKTRNHLGGAVTRLSAHLRHGCLSLAEVRDHALASVGQPRLADKLVNELAWRDYFQRVWGVLGEGVWDDVEPYKTGLAAADYAADLPPEIEAGQTGVDWVDHFAGELREIGYLHNHARLWLAAYVVHARRVRWQAGAAWFLRHLLDGDQASNNLSWQWVAGTFSAKPYLVSRGKVVHFSGDRFPPHAKNDPTDADENALRERFFPQPGRRDEFDPPDLTVGPDEPWRPAESPPDAPAVLFDNALRETTAAVQSARAAGRPVVFVHTESAYYAPTDKRRQFVRQCLDDLRKTGEIAEVGNPADAAERLGDAAEFVTPPTPDPAHQNALHALRAAGRRVRMLPDEPFVTLPKPTNLKRFSKYWKVAQKALRA